NEHGHDPSVRRWNQPLPWKGGEWSIKDIVEYDLIAARAFLEHLSRNRRQWLRDYAGINARSSTREEAPYGFVIPQDQRDPGTTDELLEILDRGLVRIDVTSDDVELDGVRWPAGTRIVSLNQPASAFAKTLLEVQEYPDLRTSSEGKPIPPYDVAGHTLPVQMGVRVVPIQHPIPADAPIAPINQPIDYEGTITGDAGSAKAWVFDEDANAS